jgi:hypothetical protein
MEIVKRLETWDEAVATIFVGIISGVSDRRGNRYSTRSELSNKGLQRNGDSHYFCASRCKSVR